MFHLPFDPDLLRQSKIFRINQIDCKLTLFWQPTDANWYMNVEAPINTVILASRRVTVGNSIMDGIITPLEGDLKCELLQNIPSEIGNPGKRPWGITHRIVFVPR